MLPDDEKLKASFATELLKSPDDAFKAALRVVGEANTGHALWMVQFWSNDAFVLAEKERLLGEQGARAFLPSKEEYARNVYEFAKDNRYEAKDRLTAYKLYGDIMGYIEKPGVNINTGNVTQNRVMVIQSVGNNDDWERKLLAQQQRLTESAGSKVINVGNC